MNSDRTKFSLVFNCMETGEKMAYGSVNQVSEDYEMESKQKQYGVVYTPVPIVELMLKKISTFEDVSICDPSCGDGQFLVAIVEKICEKIQKCKSEPGRQKYISTLKKLTGFDVDSDALMQCRKRLDNIVKNFGHRPIKWNLHEIDAIDKQSWIDFTGFDYVVGNPPYVRIQHLETSRRSRIKKGDWQCMQGCSDLYILFFEMGIQLVKPKGKLIYITPSSWMKSNSGKALRNFMLNGHNIQSFTDFGDFQVFENVTTYTVISEIQAHVAKKQSPCGWKYTGHKDGKLQFDKRKVYFGDEGWQVLSMSDSKFMCSISANGIKLGDVADIHVGIQTLADNIFILEEGSENIETEITRKVFKASVMKNGMDKINRVAIYPYRDGKLIPEMALKQEFPRAYSYLLRHKQNLLERDKGKISHQKWYGYGREVSIFSSFGDKILTSGMNPAPNFQKCPDPDALFYSGYCIKPKPEVSLVALLNELNSQKMDQFIKIVSRPFRNGWFSYAKSFIQHFPLSENIYDW